MIWYSGDKVDVEDYGVGYVDKSGDYLSSQNIRIRFPVGNGPDYNVVIVPVHTLTRLEN